MSGRLLLGGGSAVLDPKSGAIQTDILIEQGKIVAIGHFEGKTPSEAVLDATNCIVLPGFIDAHVHGEWAVFDPILAEAALRQGITSFIVGQDGCSATSVNHESIEYMSRYFSAINGTSPKTRIESLSDYLDLVDAEAYLNVGCLIPNGNLRYAAMGLSQATATASDLRTMGDLLRNDLDSGALGLSSGLDYVPSGFASAAELGALCEIVKKRSGVYVSHIRGYGDKLAEGMSEFTEVLLRSGVPGHVSHLWGKASEASRLLDEAASNGCDISFDAYPYTKGSSLLTMVAIPAELQTKGIDITIEILAERKSRNLVGVKARNVADLITISSVEDANDYHLVGMTLSQATAAANQELGDFICDLLIRSQLNVSTIIGRRDFDDNDMAWFLDDRRHMGCSDGIYCGTLPHPRGWGAFTTLVEYYLSKNPENWGLVAEHLSRRVAERFGLVSRGQLAVGAVADIAVFEPLNVKSNASYSSPRSLAAGARHVLVAGQPLIRDHVFTPIHAGRGIRG